jgi:hypothetical protein
MTTFRARWTEEVFVADPNQAQPASEIAKFYGGSFGLNGHTEVVAKDGTIINVISKQESDGEFHDYAAILPSDDNKIILVAISRLEVHLRD